MKKFFILTFLSLSAIAIARAQEFKVNKSSGKLTLNLKSATVEGYNGNEIVFKSQKSEADQDPRAKGLRAINGSGEVDNTGLGISVVESGGNVEVNQVASANLDLEIMVPKGVVISFACHKISDAGTVVFKNMENEIEISTDYNSIKLENVTGPATVRALYGQVEAKFSDNIKGPISIVSVYSTVDVAIPQSTKANVRLSSSHGDILAAADLKIEMEKTPGNDMISYGGDVNGKLNGGGADFKLTSEYGKIYLRVAGK
jgi:hypothetical protein